MNSVETTSNNSDEKNVLQSEDGELEAAEKVINSMLYYRRHVFLRLKRQADAVKLMDEKDRILLYPYFPQYVEKVRIFADENQKLFNMIVNCGKNMLVDNLSIKQAYDITQLRPASEHYMSKVRSTLKQIVRDWSSEGAKERDSCYSIVLKTIEKVFPDKEERHKINCLVAGAGLARLAWEIIQLGFSVVGNEFSIYMLLTSCFILNTCQEINEFTIYPYLLEGSNSWSYDDQLKGIKFPDVNPSICLQTRQNLFSMCAGEFIEAFKNETEKYDCVITVFFLDTSTNPIDYIRHIYRILKTGGVWINFGPLTYHFDDSQDCVSLELPFDQIIRIIKRIGFNIDELRGRGKNPPSQYASHSDSMLQYNYYCAFFQCTKI